MINNQLLEYKEWDSVFFKQAIYSLDAKCVHELSKETFDVISSGLIQVKIPADMIHALDWLQQLGFMFVESEISFIKECLGNKPSRSELNVLIAQLDDIAEIQELVARSFAHSRFRSPWFKKLDSAQFYAEWSRKAVLQQYDDICLKIENPLDNTIYGIVSGKLISEHEARIGLICVSDAWQGKNIGAALLLAIENWAFSLGIKKIHVVTQGSNQRACCFYLHNNYELKAVNYWFYKRVSQ